MTKETIIALVETAENAGPELNQDEWLAFKTGIPALAATIEQRDAEIEGLHSEMEGKLDGAFEIIHQRDAEIADLQAELDRRRGALIDVGKRYKFCKGFNDSLYTHGRGLVDVCGELHKTIDSQRRQVVELRQEMDRMVHVPGEAGEKLAEFQSRVEQLEEEQRDYFRIGTGLHACYICRRGKPEGFPIWVMNICSDCHDILKSMETCDTGTD